MRAKRVHTGKYKIVAKNSVGEDTAEIDITVLGMKIILIKTIKKKFYIKYLNSNFLNPYLIYGLINKVKGLDKL